MLRQIHPNAYFVVDTFAYEATLTRYDPLIANSTLISGWDYPVAAVIDDDDAPSPSREDWQDDVAYLEAITPTNEELRRSARRFPTPKEWFDEDHVGLY